METLQKSQYRLLILLFLLLLIAISCTSNKHYSPIQKINLGIYILGGFFRDTVTLSCNGDTILSDAVVTADHPDYGFSKIQIEFLENGFNGELLEILMPSKYVRRTVKSLPFDSVQLIINMKTFTREALTDTISIYFNKGRFIGISKIYFQSDPVTKTYTIIPPKIEIWQGFRQLSFE